MRGGCLLGGGYRWYGSVVDAGGGLSCMVVAGGSSCRLVVVLCLVVGDSCLPVVGGLFRPAQTSAYHHYQPHTSTTIHGYTRQCTTHDFIPPPTQSIKFEIQ